MKEKLELHLDFCEECFQMTNHLGDECQKCKSKQKGESRYSENDFDDDEDYRIK
jgi:hypothetical protein